MSRLSPLYLPHTRSAAEVPCLTLGERVALDYGALGRESLPDVLAVENISGWTVAADYRPHGNIILQGKDWRGQVRTMWTDPVNIRVSSNRA